MHEIEEAFVRAFIEPNRRERWLGKLASPTKRKSFLDRLNHCRDFDERYCRAIPSNVDVVALLRSHGSPATCHVISDLGEIDGSALSLEEAVRQAEIGGFGTVMSCLPGRLGYYIDEAGTERRLLLIRTT
jgi:hypothetical protein